MRQKLTYLSFVLLAFILLNCSEGVDNSITFQNMASGDVFVNFRGSKVDVPSGSTVVLEDIDRGEFQYETIYQIPSGTTNSSVEGEGAGTIIMDAGINVLVIYTSTFVDGTYTLYVSVTTSEDQTVEEDPNPIGP
jgi:hypothetical protein